MKLKTMIKKLQEIETKFPDVNVVLEDGVEIVHVKKVKKSHYFRGWDNKIPCVIIT